MSIFILGETIVLQITVWFSVNNLGYVNCTIFSWWLLILVRYLSCNNISNISNVYMTLKCSDFDISVIFINTISLHFFLNKLGVYCTYKLNIGGLSVLHLHVKATLDFKFDIKISFLHHINQKHLLILDMFRSHFFFLPC